MGYKFEILEYNGAFIPELTCTGSRNMSILTQAGDRWITLINTNGIISVTLNTKVFLFYWRTSAHNCRFVNYKLIDLIIYFRILHVSDAMSGGLIPKYEVRCLYDRLWEAFFLWFFSHPSTVLRIKFKKLLLSFYYLDLIICLFFKGIIRMKLFFLLWFVVIQSIFMLDVFHNFFELYLHIIQTVIFIICFRVPYFWTREDFSTPMHTLNCNFENKICMSNFYYFPDLLISISFLFSVSDT